MNNDCSITITVQCAEGISLSEATIAEAASLLNVQRARRSDDDQNTLVITVAEDMDAAKKVSSALARMFPGQPVKWGCAPSGTA